MPSTGSPYRKSGWTVQKLREELKRLELPTAGNKEDLIERLEVAGVTATSSSSGTPSRATVSKASRRRKTTAMIEVEVEEPEEREEESSNGSSYTSWTVHQLQAESRIRRLPISGNKSTLIERIMEDDEASTSTAAISADEADISSAGSIAAASRKRRGRPPKRVPTTTPRQADTELLNYDEDTQAEKVTLSLLKEPIVTLRYFVWMMVDYTADALHFLAHHQLLILSMLVIAAMYAYIYQHKGPYQEAVREVTASAAWYGYWALLGVASSIGLGTGLHTFLLFLGPFIAKITILAYECKNTNFSTHGPHAYAASRVLPIVHAAFYSFECKHLLINSVTPLAVYSKIWLEAFAWGAGTAIGELPPYFVARTAALAGRSDDDIDNIENLRKKPDSQKTLWERVELFMFELMNRLGFFGILLAASIPNPLFDLAGITCGHFLVPFATFFGATFIGKALIKAGIQAWFIIFLFSKETTDVVLSFLRQQSPVAYIHAREFLKKQEVRFSGNAHDAPTDPDSWISTLWNGFIAVMIAYFLLSIMQSLAVAKLKKENERSKSVTVQRNTKRSTLRTKFRS